MCMLCEVQNWSRRVIRVLPWLVIPLVGLWALSHLLAPGLQFEITSPRLACVAVLLGTVFWYEVVLPRWAVYRARRSARVQEQQRTQAAELFKLRKTATRRCRNCLTAYREQNPGGGKFMCSSCGHVSKRPVLDLPGPPGRSGFISKLFGNNSWFCRQGDSVEGGENCVNPFPPHWEMPSEEQFLTEKSYSGSAVSTRNLLSLFFSCVKWFYRRVLRLKSYAEAGFCDSEHREILSRRGENGVSYQESKGEKARRKAEEKRQVRLEKEMLEEEERKQREDVARLVEERRKLREAEKGRLRSLTSDGERGSRIKSENRRHDRKEKDKNSTSSKGSSDAEGNEKRGTNETEKKHEYERKGEARKWDPCNPRIEGKKINTEVVNSIRGVANKSKYFDHTRARGAFLTSSGSLNRNTSFEKGYPPSTASITKSSNPTGGFADHMQRKECHAIEHVIGKSLSNGDAMTVGTSYPQHTQTTTLKRSWHQLFTCPSAGLPCPDANAMGRLNPIGQPEVQLPQLLDQKTPDHPLHDQMQFEQPSTFTAYPLSNSLTGNSASVVAESRLSLAGDPEHNFTIEEAKNFEEPCYVPDSVSLVGPVLESLDNFFVDTSSGIAADFRPDSSYIVENVSDSADANKPSPIELPLSKLRLSEERHIATGPCPKSEGQGDSPGGESNDVNEQGTWQMWSSPLCQDLLSLVRGPASFLLASRQIKNAHEEIIHPQVHNPVASHDVEENNILQSTINHPQSFCFGSCQNDGMMSKLAPIMTENDSWLQGTDPFPGDGGSHVTPLDFNCSASQNVVVCESPKRSAVSQAFDQLPTHSWSKDWAVHGAEDIWISNIPRPHTGGFVPANPDVQTIWSSN